VPRSASELDRCSLRLNVLIGSSSGTSHLGAPPCEYAIDLRLKQGEVGCRWQTVDGSSPPEALRAASADWVRIHPDEFVEAFAHSHLGCWGSEWLGFRAEHSVLPQMRKAASLAQTCSVPGCSAAADAPAAGVGAGAGAEGVGVGLRICADLGRSDLGSAREPSLERVLSSSKLSSDLPSRMSSAEASPTTPRGPMLLKRLAFRRLHTVYTQPRALCLRITSGPDSRVVPGDVTPGKPALRPLPSRMRARVDVLLCGEVSAASLALQDAMCAQQPLKHPLPTSAGGFEGFCAGDALDKEGGRAVADAVAQLLSCVSAEHRDSLLSWFCAQIGALIEALADGSYFQFAAASLWCICEAGGDGGMGLLAEAEGGTGSGIPTGKTKPLAGPAVQLSHFADMSMHRDAGCHPGFSSALSAIHTSLRSLGASVRGAADGEGPFEMSGL